jgi:hypothetical protein
MSVPAAAAARGAFVRMRDRRVRLARAPSSGLQRVLAVRGAARARVEGGMNLMIIPM